MDVYSHTLLHTKSFPIFINERENPPKVSTYRCHQMLHSRPSHWFELPVWKLPMRSCAPRISVKSSISLLVLFLLRTKAPIHLCALDGFFSKVTPQLRGPAAPFGINQADIADSFGPLRRIFARFPF